MNIWYQLTPADTLFFRGAEPMEAGQLSGSALFPPPVSVICGALRSAALRQSGISFADYNRGTCPPERAGLIGQSGQPAPFAVTAIIILKGDTLYLPCPAHWFMEKEGNGKRRIVRGKPPAQETAEALGLYSSAGLALPMVLSEDEPMPLAGRWLRSDRLSAAQVAADDVLASSVDLYDAEPRIGIALDEKRRVKEGALYSASHLRLRPDVSLVIGLDRSLGLAASGLLRLGGEQRVCGYRKIEPPNLPGRTGPSSWYLTLAPLKLTSTLKGKVLATSKPVMLAGWDLDKGFHKASETWLPAGAVVSENINNHCLALPE
jgi:CRISPR-associated protein Cmr3